MSSFFTLLSLSLYLVSTKTLGAPGTFEIQNDEFLLNGSPFRIISGSLHYNRVVPELWEDRMLRLRALGVNTVQFYVPWNWHEPFKDQLDWSTPEKDLSRMIQMAQRLKLLVILRPGPYICGEWEWGGFPAWLLKDGVIKLRTFAEPYITHVTDFWDGKGKGLLHQVKPFLIQNGGPIILVQIENEFGSYGDASRPKDKQYLKHLVAVARSVLGKDIILFTTDGGSISAVKRGSLEGGDVFTVTDGSDPETCDRAQRSMNLPGKSPLWSSEYYSGWLTHWGEPVQNRTTASFTQHLTRFLDYNGSVNIYVTHGGTNFGFWSGANGNGKTSYAADITSYDYNAPISECGRHGYGRDGINKYKALQRLLRSYSGLKYDEPPAPIVSSYPTVYLHRKSEVLDSYNLRTSVTRSYKPLPMESSSCYSGFMLYEFTFPRSVSNGILSFREIRDRAQIFLSRRALGTISRSSFSSLSLDVVAEDVLQVFVENMGRIGFAHGMDDERKGIVYEPLLNGELLRNSHQGWSMSCLDFSKPVEIFNAIKWKQRSGIPSSSKIPQMYRGELEINTTVTDTYVSMKGWNKGVVWINHINLGRYWTAKGPQQNLYIPAAFLSQGINTIVVLELEPLAASSNTKLEFIDKQQWIKRSRSVRLKV